jgi:hypothetical protein
MFQIVVNFKQMPYEQNRFERNHFFTNLTQNKGQFEYKSYRVKVIAQSCYFHFENDFFTDFSRR